MASEETVRVEEIVSKVSLREITDENREAVVALRIAESQEGVVARRGIASRGREDLGGESW